MAGFSLPSLGGSSHAALPAVHPIAMALHAALQGGHAITIHPAAHAPALGHVSLPTHVTSPNGVSLFKQETLGGNKFHTNRFALG